MMAARPKEKLTRAQRRISLFFHLSRAMSRTALPFFIDKQGENL